MKTKLFAALMLSGLAFIACSKENGGEKQSVSLQGEPTEVTLHLTNGTKLRDLGTEEGTALENKVKTLEFYVFNSDKSIDTQVGKIDDNDGPGYVKVSIADGEELKSQKIIVSAGTGKKFVAVVNCVPNIGPLASGDDYDDLIAKLSGFAFINVDPNHNARLEDRPNGFEMTGEKVEDIVEKKDDNKVIINVSRLSAKLHAPTFWKDRTATVPVISDVELTDNAIKKLWGDATIITNDDLTFEPLGYVVINGLDNSGAFFTGNSVRNDELKVTESSDPRFGLPNWPDWSMTGKDHLNSSFQDKFYTNVYSGKGKAADWFLNFEETDNEHRVYVYENKPQTHISGGQSGYDPSTIYAFIVKGNIKVDGEPTLTKTRYWRINLTRQTDYYILRNCTYTVNMNKVSTPGYGTPEEAEKENPVIPGADETAADVEVIVNAWRADLYETEM